MRIGVLTHDSSSHITGIEHMLLALAEENIVYVVIRKSFENFLPKHQNIHPIIFGENIEKSIAQHYKTYAMKIGGLGSIREFRKLDDYICEVAEPLKYLLKGNQAYVLFCKEKLKKINIDVFFRDACALYGREVAYYFNVPIIGYTTTSIVNDSYIQSNKLDSLEDIFNWDLSQLTNSDLTELKKGIEKEIGEISESFGIEKLPIAYLQDPGEQSNICFSIPWLKNFEHQNYFITKPKIFTQEAQNIDFWEEMRNEIYISSGSETVFTGLAYNHFINALKKREEKVTISFRYINTDLVKIQKIPSNIYFEEYSNQKEKLKNSKLFITHGGYNSIQESLFYRVPMIVIPLTSDMFFNGRMIEENGLGVKLNKKILSTQIVEETIEYLLDDLDTKENIYKMWKKTNNLQDVNKVISDLL